METKIAACMNFADWANLASEADRVVKYGADWLHFDIMDGHFVPFLTIGSQVVARLRKHTEAYLDCHLMVTNPLDYVEHLGHAGASGFTFHIEASKDIWQELVQKIKEKGMRPGVALKPETPIEEIYPLVEDENPVELVLIMTAQPGYSPLMPEMVDKVRALRKKYPTLDIQVDGGLGHGNIKLVANAGANYIVAGISVFLALEPVDDLAYYRKILEESQQGRRDLALNKVKETTEVVKKSVVLKVDEELEEALANFKKQKEETIKAFDSQVAAFSEMVKVFKKALPV